ncbi:terminase TerL endonuclease subunit [Pseudaminobacter sp. NGMCC 1.201702]|uniref:terminase TerL endonuclease subunit n=1 Tax=Pseudaminobacter sp. NGMCC 1.201702 TaxID=3391825 RepID=UPI0039F0CA5F
MGVVTRGGRNIAWIEAWLKIPEGRDVGKPVRLRKWQKDEIKKIYDNPAGTRRAILSFGRKNGKTALAAFLLLLHLCGPEARPNSQLFSAAQSREQAAVLFALAAKMVRMNPGLDINRGGFVGVRDSGKQLYCPELGTLYRALSADASTAYGLSPVFIVHDELGQVKGPRSELYEALETATGAQDDPISIVISTQAPTDADLLSVLIDDAKKGADPRTVVSLYTADEGLDPFSVEAMKAANPAFGDFQNPIETQAMAEDARRMSSREPEYRNLILNQRVDMNAPFVSQSVWKGCGADVIASFEGLPVYGGLDLSETADLTALVLVAPADGVWHVKPTFWLPRANLADKARIDRVPYDLWHREGHLMAAPGKTVDYEYVAEHIRGLFDRLDIMKIAFDAWNWRHLKPWLLKAGFDEAQLEGDYAVFEQMRQGFQTMSPALRDLESSLLNQKIAHGMHPVLTMCAANATVQTDPAGNRKLSKIKSHGRIDGMVALAMAMSVAGTYEADTGPSFWEVA